MSNVDGQHCSRCPEDDDFDSVCRKRNEGLSVTIDLWGGDGTVW